MTSESKEVVTNERCYGHCGYGGCGVTWSTSDPSVDGDRATTVGATLPVEVDLTRYGSPGPEDTAVEWEIDDPRVLTTEASTMHGMAPNVYRNTVLLRAMQVGATTVRATHSLAVEHDPWDLVQVVIEVPVTIAPEAGTAFVIIRDGKAPSTAATPSA